MGQRLRLTRRDWKQIIARSIFFTLIGVVVSLAGAHYLLSTYSGGLDVPGTVATIALPLIVGAPMTFYLSLQNAQLNAAYRQLEAVAARDSLTACLNHGSFVAQANAFLESDEPHKVHGALLVVDADHFKSVNDRFGHHIGDVALKQIAARIQAEVGKGDFVGRLGGEEFGVMLPGADRNRAQAVAEGIRKTVQSIEFEVEGHCFNLSVSIGGAVFEQKVKYSQLFRFADQSLYRVKNSGRNSVDLVPFAAGHQEPESERRQAG